MTVADANNPGNTVLSTQVSQPAGAAPWVLFSQSFTANSSLTTFSIIDTQGGSNGGIYLDNVSVNPLAPAGVPDSGSSLGMMLLGVLSLGFVARHWRNGLCA